MCDKFFTFLKHKKNSQKNWNILVDFYLIKANIIFCKVVAFWQPNKKSNNNLNFEQVLKNHDRYCAVTFF